MYSFSNTATWKHYLFIAECNYKAIRWYREARRQKMAKRQTFKVSFKESTSAHQEGRILDRSGTSDEGIKIY